MRLAALFFTLLALAGCQQPLDPAATARIHAIGVYSDCGRTLRINPDATIFNYTDVDISDAKVDVAIPAAVERYFAGHVSVVPATEVEGRHLPGPLPLALEGPHYRTDTPVDAYLVVSRGSIDNGGFGGALFRDVFTGSSITYKKFFSDRVRDIPLGNSFVFALCRADLIDAKSGVLLQHQIFADEALATTTIRPLKTTTSASTINQGIPFSQVDYPPIRPWDDYTPDEKAFVLRQLGTVLDSGLVSALTRMGFAPPP